MDKLTLKQLLIDALRQSPGGEDVKSLALFGSAARGDDRPDSDVDVLVEFYPQAHVGFFKLAQLQRSLSHAVSRTVDLVTPDALSKYLRPDILSQAELFYEK